MEGGLFNKIYISTLGRVPWGYKVPDLDFVDAIEKLHLPPKAKVLDMGCGNGKNSAYLKKYKFRIYGFDILEKAISIVKKRVPSGQFIVADAEHLPYANELFDVAIDWGMLHCIPPRKITYVKKEILRILKPKGYYITRVYFCSKGHLASVPLFYENVDGSGRTKERDLLRHQFPVWGFNFRKVSHFFSRDFIIKSEFYFGNRIIIKMEKK